MLKKTLAVVGLAGALMIGSASAAFADNYPPAANVTVAAPTITPGGSTVITATGLGDRTSVTFSVSGSPGATLTSLVVAAGSSYASVNKPVVDGTASATFSASTPGNFTVTISDGATILGTSSISVADPAGAGGSGGSGSELPPTGGAVPATVIWAGVGAIGLGGIAVAAVAARRRTQSR
ncbi:hypothetical protein ACFC3F_12965 [Microbacterium sp. NPDC055910]|uniref:hypothetical protein n=1 Tax=Microbacterium sp. NPDC055910 TaxID=3345659 RepID=UPI0035DCE456